MSKEEQNKYYKYFYHNKVKEIYTIQLSDVTYNNLMHKGFLYAYMDDLEGLNYKQEKLFTLLQKWNGFENMKGIGEKNVLNRDFQEIGSKLSLSWITKNRNGSKRTIITLLEFLKTAELIKDYEKIDKYRVKIILFSEEEYKKIRAEKKKAKNENIIKVNEHLAAQDSYLGEIYTTQMKEEPVNDGIIDVKYEKSKADKQIVPITKPEVKEDTNQTSQQVQQLIANVPTKHRKKNKLIKVLTNYLKTHGADYVQKNIEYANQQTPRFFLAYLTDALAENYAKNNSEKENVNPKILEAKQIGRNCFNNPTIGCANNTWDSYTEVDGCFWCEKHKDKRLANTNKEQESINTSKVVELTPPPVPKPQKIEAQTSSHDGNELGGLKELSEIELLRQQMILMQKQMQDLQRSQLQKEAAFKEEIHQLKSDKEKLKLQREPTATQTNKNQAAANKWLSLQDDLKNHPVLKLVYHHYVKTLKFDVEHSNNSTIVLFSDNKMVIEKLSEPNNNILPLIQSIAGEEFEIFFNFFSKKSPS